MLYPVPTNFKALTALTLSAERRVVDPNCKTKAASAFASKQLLHEPFMGGGLWTGMAIPMLVIYGGWHVLIITSTAIAIWSLYLFFSPRN